MAIDIIVPPLSQTMDSLVLVAWVKKIGDPVVKGETLYQVETDKATLEVEFPATGILKEILAEAGAEVLVRSKIGVIAVGENDTNIQPGAVATLAHGSVVSPAKNQATKVATTDENARAGRILASPRARNLAKAEGISLEQVKASGPQGMIVERDIRATLDAKKLQTKAPVERVTPLARRMAEAVGVDLETVSQGHSGTVIKRSDIEAALQSQEKGSPPVAVVAPVALPGKGHPVALTSLRKTIARRMHDSHLATAPVTITREVDATRLVVLREDILKELAEGDVRPTYTDFLVAIVTRVLARHPNLNALFDGETLELSDEVHVGVAIDTERGLVAPVIHSTTNKGLHELTTERQRLVKKATEGTLAPDELNGGTFTITNLGSLGVDGFTPIINLPQVAILGIGRIRPVAAVFEDQVSIRQGMVLSLTFDHRVIDGAPAARFLQDVAQLIEKPQLVWL